MGDRIKVAGHGIKRRMGEPMRSATHSHVLVWGAEKCDDGKVHAALYEYTGSVTIGGDADPERWEPAIYSAIHHGEWPTQFDCNCSAHGLCRKHGDKAALAWWDEAKRRRAGGGL